MALLNSLDKIISYFSCITKQPFKYKSKIFHPRDLQISPTLFRDFVCPANCGGCCSKFSLDYLKKEEHPYKLKKKIAHINGKDIAYFSDEQTDNSNHHCHNLNMENGRCEIHGAHPFSCDFELIRFTTFTDPHRPNIISNKLYGRGMEYVENRWRKRRALFNDKMLH